MSPKLLHTQMILMTFGIHFIGKDPRGRCYDALDDPDREENSAGLDGSITQ